MRDRRTDLWPGTHPSLTSFPNLRTMKMACCQVTVSCRLHIKLSIAVETSPRHRECILQVRLWALKLFHLLFFERDLTNLLLVYLMCRCVKQIFTIWTKIFVFPYNSSTKSIAFNKGETARCLRQRCWLIIG